jgi:uncharacterized protein (DUF58 family)
MSTFLTFLLFLLVLAAVLRVDFFFYVLYLFFGLYVLAGLWVRRTLGRLAVQRRFTERAFLGEQVTIHLDLTNRSVLPMPWLHLRETRPLKLVSPPTLERVVSLGPRERLTVTYTLHARSRGYYPMGPLRLDAGDVLGLAAEQRQLDEIEHLVVYPQIVPLAALGLPSRSPLGTLRTQQRIFEDPARVIGVRDYETGDSLRLIHWKASASTGRLQVKKLEPAISLETAIFLNLNAAEYELRRRTIATEFAIVVAASVANYVVAQRQTAGLYTNGRDPLADSCHSEARSAEESPSRQIETLRSPLARTGAQGDREKILAVRVPPGRGRPHLMRVLDVLARVEVEETFPFAELLYRDSVGLPWGTTLVAITGQEDEALVSALLTLRRRGFLVVVILVDEPTGTGLLERAGLTVRRITDERDLRRWAGAGQRMERVSG